MGWLTVLAYLLVALASWHRSRTVSPDAFPVEQRFWRRLTVIVLLLGVNKQLNFLTLFTMLGRSWAWQQQWYAGRQAVQLALVGIVVLLLVTVAGIRLWRLRRLPRRYLLAQILILLLVGFVLVRGHVFARGGLLFVYAVCWHSVELVVELGLLVGLFVTAVSPTHLPPQSPPAPALPRNGQLYELSTVSLTVSLLRQTDTVNNEKLHSPRPGGPVGHWPPPERLYGYQPFDYANNFQQ
ncbi:MAG: hypothetical protein IPJ90_08295 [Anaerolineaceae bacterium]|nr:hypothetical protein [Anaerolineaceae bacterium]